MGSHTDKYTDSVWSRTTYGAEYPRYLLCEVQQLSPGKLRFVFLERSMRLVYPVGERCVLYLTQNKRENDTIFLNRCSRVTIENVTIRRGPCMGIIAQQCSDITVKNMKIAPLPGRGDLTTTTADSMMFVDCSGRICINGCYISCSLDDGVNIHGTYVPIDRSNDSVVFAHSRNSKLLQAEGTDHLTFSDNVYSYTETSTQEEMFLLNRCGNSVSLEPPR